MGFSDDYEYGQEYETEYDDEPFESDLDDSILCSQCRNLIYEDSPRCPYCGEYVRSDTSWLSQRPGWLQALWIVVVGILIVQLIGWCF